METIGSNIRISEDEHLTGIAGWLTFALIILCLTAVGLVLSMVGPFFAPPVTNESWIEIVVSGVLLIFAIWVLYNFFGRKRRTRVLAIIFFGVASALNLLNLAMIMTYPEPDASQMAGAVRGVIASLPLAIYFVRSRRVKNTFVN